MRFTQVDTHTHTHTHTQLPVKFLTILFFKKTYFIEYN